MNIPNILGEIIIANGKTVRRFQTLEENKIKNSDIIKLNTKKINNFIK